MDVSAEFYCGMLQDELDEMEEEERHELIPDCRPDPNCGLCKGTGWVLVKFSDKPVRCVLCEEGVVYEG
jgi:hypothetical protein